MFEAHSVGLRTQWVKQIGSANLICTDLLARQSLHHHCKEPSTFPQIPGSLCDRTTPSPLR